jgi:hypothetical protein
MHLQRWGFKSVPLRLNSLQLLHEIDSTFGERCGHSYRRLFTEGLHHSVLHRSYGGMGAGQYLSASSGKLTP